MLKTSVLSLVFAVAAVAAFGALLAKPGEGRKQRPAEAVAAQHGGADSRATALDAIPGHDGNGANPHHGTPSRSAIAALPMTAPVVRVNDVTFTRADLEKVIQQHAMMAGIPPGAIDGRMRDALEASAYDKLIERELLATEARRRGLWPSDADVTAQRDKLIAQLPAGKTFQEALTVLGTDEATFMASLRSDIAMGKLFDAMKKDQPALDEAALRKVYEDNKAKFVVKDSASASHILVRLDQGASPEQEKAALEKAKAIRAEVAGKDGETFKKVATEKSDDPSAKANGGDLGTFAKGDMVEEFEGAAFALKEGEISEPVRSPFGFHIIRGGGVRAGGQKSFDEMKQMIADREGMRSFMETVDTLLDGLKSAAKISRIQEPVPAPVSPADAAGPNIPPPPSGAGGSTATGSKPPGAG